MKRKHVSAQMSRGIRIALFFGSIFILLIGIALVIKGILLIQRSRFDREHQFILQVLYPGSRRDLIVFEPDAQAIAQIHITNISSGVNGSSYVQIPIDATMTAPSQGSVRSLMRGILFHFNSSHAALTILDDIELTIDAYTTPESSIVEQSLQVPLNDQQAQKVFSQYFTDKSIYREGLSVAIINATGVSGLGNKVATLLSHVGVNIVSVVTAQQEADASSLTYTQHLSYTVKRLRKILGFSKMQQGPVGLSDITITIGKEDTGRL